MKKNGFTLIELLATIIILGIVSVISVPIITNLIEAARTKAYSESVKAIERAAENYVMDGGELEDGKVTIQTLLTEGYLKSIDDNISRNSYVSCDKHDGIYTYAYSGKTQEVTVTLTKGDGVAYVSLNGCTLTNISSNTITYTCEAATKVTLTATSSVGYTLGSWESEDVEVNNNIFYVPNSDVSLSISTNMTNYTITLDNQNGTANSSITTNYNTNLPSVSIPSKSGYTFAGYYTEAGEKYIKSNGSSNKVWDIDNDTTLYAHYVTTTTNYATANSTSNPYYAFTTPETGYYKVELWGAQGGSYSTYYGGKGAYTSGIVNLNKGNELYAYVGGAGEGCSGKDCFVTGGYNGGGNGSGIWSSNESATQIKGSGGGATDIRCNGNSLNDRIIVSAGGGGTEYFNIVDNYCNCPGGPGGGLNGIAGECNYSPSYSSAVGSSGVATQTSAGYATYTNNTVYSQFGIGKNGYSGGGAGYYGGASQYAYTSGGSSFISGYPGCVAITSSSSITPKTVDGVECTDSETNATRRQQCSEHYSGKVFVNGVMKAGNESMPAPGGGTETGHSGDGYARITYVGDVLPNS